MEQQVRPTSVWPPRWLSPWQLCRAYTVESAELGDEGRGKKAQKSVSLPARLSVDTHRAWRRWKEWRETAARKKQKQTQPLRRADRTRWEVDREADRTGKAEMSTKTRLSEVVVGYTQRPHHRYKGADGIGHNSTAVQKL